MAELATTQSHITFIAAAPCLPSSAALSAVQPQLFNTWSAGWSEVPRIQPPVDAQRSKKVNLQALLLAVAAPTFEKRKALSRSCSRVSASCSRCLFAAPVCCNCVFVRSSCRFITALFAGIFALVRGSCSRSCSRVGLLGHGGGHVVAGRANPARLRHRRLLRSGASKCRGAVCRLSTERTRAKKTP